MHPKSKQGNGHAVWNTSVCAATAVWTLMLLALLPDFISGCSMTTEDTVSTASFFLPAITFLQSYSDTYCMCWTSVSCHMYNTIIPLRAQCVCGSRPMNTVTTAGQKPLYSSCALQCHYMQAHAGISMWASGAGTEKLFSRRPLCFMSLLWYFICFLFHQNLYELVAGYLLTIVTVWSISCLSTLLNTCC